MTRHQSDMFHCSILRFSAASDGPRQNFSRAKRYLDIESERLVDKHPTHTQRTPFAMPDWILKQNTAPTTFIHTPRRVLLRHRAGLLRLFGSIAACSEALAPARGLLRSIVLLQPCCFAGSVFLARPFERRQMLAGLFVVGIAVALGEGLEALVAGCVPRLLDPVCAFAFV